ncbi:glutamate-1-semialdehyde 2,1-aminomutase [Peptoclostridium litorale DSM 5388]|uniref:Glutamate-1-semialdehyde 2,1-aminomutase n=1 Tax=Peptoclostridium litorale DSM 5388 TaxID=1121324 RepID=A0A069RK67_PEPLI|nr:glutamate-1-semialdehyde 2,1-aminomutase [Peptoclostridium litorale]KDR96525.1 glutamate-1-semialdehyde 2,1-aminomutase HemL [Peptoclostridium litorale DSM 5388]SIN69561.1 glutamate-1-semialdehyde 2,1-aminomutase [Peptoclostridium litorale DSM 5388]
MDNKISKGLYEEAKKYIPGGVNSPVRAFKSVGLDPIFIERAKGSRIYDVDGNSYIDYVCSWGPLILGHANDDVIGGIEEVVRRGTSYGVPSPVEVDMAKLIVEAFPSVDMVRMVNSGTEATMSALRLARAYTSRKKIIKFEGCYHGHSDSLLVKAGSGAMTFGVPTSPGVPEDIVKNTIVCTYNDMDSVKKAFEDNKGDVAAVIFEPVAGNMGVVIPEAGFIKGLREITREEGALLISDEVITGFRLSYGGAQEVFGFEADITCFGKIIGAGLPVGAYGGRRDIMENLSPIGPVYQAGTLSGNPLAMHMGCKNLNMLKNNPGIYEGIEKMAIQIEEGLNAIIDELRIDACVNRIKGMLCLFFAKGPVKTYDDVMRCDTEKYSVFFREMLNAGILMPPAQFEGWFLSSAHSDEDIEYTLVECKKALKKAFGK